MFLLRKASDGTKENKDQKTFTSLLDIVSFLKFHSV